LKRAFRRRDPKQKADALAAWLFAASVTLVLFGQREGARAAAATAVRTPAVIIMYHHVSPLVLPGPYAKALTVTPAEFEQQLAWLRSRGCAAVTVDQIARDAMPQGAPRCKVALTFDDGYDDAVRFALPLLLRYQASATFYVTSGFVGQPGHLTRSGVQALARAGMEIGAHTVHHYDLTSIPLAQASLEIAQSRQALRAWSGSAVSTFAYPAGRVNAPVAAAVRAAGFASAVTTEPGDVVPSDDRLLLPRYRMLRGEGRALFAAVLGQRGDASPKTQAAYDLALHRIARQRIAGNEPRVAESVAVALLVRRFAEPVMKVHVLAIPRVAVAGIVLSGAKFHAPVSRTRFASDVRAMTQAAFAAAPSLSEVDVWATVPVAVPAGEPVSGDFAVPTSKTVFSSVATRQRKGLETTLEWGTTYWDPRWLQP